MKKSFTLDEKLPIDLGRLVETRALIQANSGGGKSYLIRKLLEETHGKIQQIVLDMEGEFTTLREKFDYILAGKGGDIPADPKSADLLARKILELETSLIVDLYELKKPDRVRFVKNFVDSLVNAPKELYHPVLVIIDEAHVFVPEKGESEAMGAVIDLCTRGRKRGFCAILATQRISSLSKDAAAQCLNKFVGRTSLDIDRKRAGDDLGFLTSKDNLALRNLKPGQFYVFGPAISDAIELIQVGEVQTTHPKAGQRLGSNVTKPTAHIRDLLKKLVDLPQEAEEELRDKQSMQQRIRELERELRKKPEPQIDIKTVETAEARGRMAAGKAYGRVIEQANRAIKRAREAVAALQEIALPEEQNDRLPAIPGGVKAVRLHRFNFHAEPSPAVSSGDRTFGLCERKILGFLSLRPGEFFTRVQVGAMTGYSNGSGGFNNALSNLAQAGLISRSGGSIALNPEADVSDLVDQTPHRLEDWIAKLGACERRIYQLLLSQRGKVLSREEVASETGYSAGSGGFNNALSRLNTLGLITRHQGGRVGLNEEIAGL